MLGLSQNPKALDLTGILTIPAANYTPANRDQIALIVLHSAETLERKGTARNLANWAAGMHGVLPPKASWHYGVDAEEIIRSVRDQDVAWAAPGANSNGLHIEHAGRASQTAAGWADGFSMAVLERSIRLSIALCLRWDIPPVLVGVNGLLAGEHGITTHFAVTQAFKKSTHTDPGPHFPLDWYVARVAQGVEEAK